MTEKIKTFGPYSVSRWADNLMFISGQLGVNLKSGKLEAGFKDQCARSLSNIQIILESEDLTLDNIVKLTVLMDDLEDFDEVNNVFEEFFTKPYPSRSAFEVARLPKDALIEIEVIASKKID